MEPILIIVGILVGGAALVNTLWRSHQESGKRIPETWEEDAVSCGLQAVKAPTFWNLPIEAGARRLWVRIEKRGEQGEFIRIVVTIPGLPDFHILPEFHNVRLRPDGSFIWGREVEIGDESFDNAFFIEGSARMALSLLDAETRPLLLRLRAESQLDVSTGMLEAVMPKENLSVVLPLLLDVSQRFAQPIEIPRRLAENAIHDPAAGVRHQNLLLLIREFPEDPRTAEVLRMACSDPSPRIRLRAAKELGAEGHDTLLKLTENLEDDTISAEAVSIMNRELPFERTKAILDSARGLRHIQTAHACLEVLGRSGDAAAVDTLAKVLALEKGELAHVAAQALGETGSPAAEPPLILALQREDKDLQVAAAKALGRVGAVAAVLPLKEAAESSWLGLELRRAARQAIAEIQSRLSGASPGQLSLAGAETGQLSLAQADAGQLSLSTDSAGQLSLGDAEKPPEEA